MCVNGGWNNKQVDDHGFIYITAGLDAQLTSFVSFYHFDSEQ